MADWEVSQLPVKSAPAATTDYVPILDTTDTSTPPAGAGGSDKRSTIQAAVKAGAGLTTQGDLMVGGSSGVPQRLAAGASSLVLTSNGAAALPSWQAASSGFSNPMTTQGDLITGGSSGTPQRLGAGTSGYVLTSGGAGVVPSWAPASGGTGTPTFVNVKASPYNATGNGTTDDTTAVKAAIAAALATGNGTATVYFPAGTYKITSSLNCTSAAGSGGFGVLLAGDGRLASTILKSGSNFALCAFNGSGGPTGNPTGWGGTKDITLSGDSSHTGPLLQTNSAQQMFFENTSFINNPDLTFDIQSTEDSYFVGCTSNNCGSATQPALRIYGSVSNGTSNMLWFIQTRIEAFLDGAVKIDTGANNGIFFSQCKFESTTIHGDVIQSDGTTQQLVIDQCFFGLDSFASGYSTPANAVKFGDGASASGDNTFTLSNCAVYAGSGVMNSVLNVNGDSGAMGGPLEIRNITWYAAPVTSAFIFNGCAGFDVQMYAGSYGLGTILSGDGSYFKSGGGDGDIALLAGLAIVNDVTASLTPAGPTLNAIPGSLGVLNADLPVGTVGKGLRVKEGTNAKQGTATLNGTTAVVVSNTSVTASSRIFMTIQSPGGTVGSPYVSARTAGTSFSIKSTVAGDTSTVAYEIFEPA